VSVSGPSELAPDDLRYLARLLADERVAVVGGQALNLWAELLFD